MAIYNQKPGWIWKDKGRLEEKDMKKAICMLLVMMMIIGATVTAQAAG